MLFKHVEYCERSSFSDWRIAHGATNKDLTNFYAFRKAVTLFGPRENVTAIITGKDLRH